MGASDQERRGELIEQLTLLGQIDATQTALFQQQAAATYRLGITEMKALDILSREGARTAGQLAHGLHLTSGAVTSLVDRLERRGFAHRRADPSDRRRVLVEVDRESMQAEGNVYRAIGAAFARLYAGYSTAELAFLVRHLEASIEITRQETERLQSAD
jgi:DNA-binding MarR family transcriptional regulator